MNKDHLILRPAEYAHQNIDRYSIVDSSNVRGGRRSVYSVTDMYNIPEDKLSENVSIVYVESEDTEYRLTDISNKGNYKGWVELKYGSDSPAKIATKGAIKQSTSGDTVTLNLSLALESGLNSDPLSIKIADSSKEYLYLNSNGLNFNSNTITSAVSGQIKDFQAQVDSKQDTLNSSNTVSIDTYDNNKLKVILNKGEGYLIETNNGLDTNIQPTLDKKADLINGIVPASQLPSYIDDIRNLTYMKAGSPNDITGTVLGELYYNTSSNTLFEWKSVVPEGETSAVTKWVQIEPSSTTIYLYTGSEPYTQWRWVSDPGVLQKINQDLAWSNGVCTSHIVDGSTQSINVNILKDDPLLKVENNILQSNPAKDWGIWGENLIFNEVTGKIDGLNTSYTAGDGIAIDNSTIRRKDVVAKASAVSNVYTVNFAYPLQTVSNVNSNLTISLPTSNGNFVGPVSGETKTVIVQILNKASSSITVTLPTSISGVTVYNMYSKPNVILMANQLGELWITATESTVTIKAFVSYVANYNITVIKSQNGTTNVQSTAIANEEVAISFVPNTGYTDSPTITIINVTTGEELPYSVSKTGDVTFVMPESDVNITTIFNPISIGEAVDLGLPSGTLWANMNIGATNPEEYGNYYAWGETETKTTYSWSTYFDTTDGGSTFTKYTTAGKTVLDLEDDAANVNWGGTWRIPTDEQIQELIDNCTWTQTTLNDINGFKVKSTNGNYIFLPFAGYSTDDLHAQNGYGQYWSSSLGTDYSYTATLLYIIAGGERMSTANRHHGYSIRPVKSPQPTTQIYYNATSDLSTSVSSTLGSVNLVADSCTYNSATGDGVLAYSGDITEIASLYFDNKTQLRTISLPNTVTSIGNLAFQDCSSLTQITIPQSVNSINDQAFFKCSGLTSVTIPNSITNLGDGIFYRCSSLTSIIIPNSVKSIGIATFSHCSGLTSITIPNSVTSIGNNGFYSCNKLATINYTGTTEQWSAIDKGLDWITGVAATIVKCTDGDVNI